MNYFVRISEEQISQNQFMAQVAVHAVPDFVLQQQIQERRKCCAHAIQGRKVVATIRSIRQIARHI